jgi:hypothetical protein
MGYLIAAALGVGLGVALWKLVGYWALAFAYVVGSLVVIALSEDEELEDKRQINRMADESRRARPAAVRQRGRYSKAGWQ